MKHVGFGLAHGTLGELIQGKIQMQPFLITCPINRYAVARFVPSNRPDISGPRHKTKSLLALSILQKLINGDGGELYLSSNIPVGKGMASSSADIVATCRAYAAAHQVELPPTAISRIASSVEPTDGVMYDRIIMYDHMRGRFIRSFGQMDSLMILSVDTGGEVDTVAFHRSADIAYTKSEQKLLAQALEMLCRGFRTRSSCLVGEAATLSARVNQRFLLKPNLERFISFAKDRGAAGVVVAHSGTVMGILWDVKVSGSYLGAKSELARQFGPVSVFSVIQGTSTDITLATVAP